MSMQFSHVISSVKSIWEFCLGTIWDWKSVILNLWERSPRSLAPAFFMDEEGSPRPLVPRPRICAAQPCGCIPDDTVKQQIMDALRIRDPGINIIGLCGPDERVQHSAKTTIRRVERDQLFQKIVTATVTNKPDIAKIQTQIGDEIGLHFDDKSDVAESTSCTCFGTNKRITTADRAVLLCAKMKELQTVLVILYDLHGRLDLGEIGIPFGDDHNGCKIILTSTNLEVLSGQMKVDKLIQSYRY